MDKNRTKLIITGVLILFFVLAWANAFKVLAKKGKSKNPRSAPAALTSTPYPVSVVASVKMREWAPEEGLDWKRCPFSGRSYFKQSSAADLSISGIIWDETKPQTIINGHILSEGEKIGDFVIERIEKQKVILFDGVKTIELSI